MFNVHDALPKSVYSIATQVFTRAGSYLGVAAKPFRHTKMQDMGRWGTTDIFLVTGRGGAAGARGGNQGMKLRPVHHGVRVPFAVQGSPTELTLLTAYGSIRFCFAETGLLLIRGENDLHLRLEADLDLHRIIRKREGQSWELGQSASCCLVYTPVVGTLELTAPFDMDKLSTPQVRGEVFPDETGTFLFAVEEFRELGYVRPRYPDYEEGLRSAEADWQSFLARFPAPPDLPADARERAVYQTWSMLTKPSGRAKHTQIWRDFGHVTDAFQSCLCAAALGCDLPLAVELLLGQLDEQAPSGQIPVFFDDMRGLTQTVVPPAQGWALDQLMRTHDLKAELSAETLGALYDGFSKWADWYDAYRSVDGLPRYESGEESGLEDSPVFRAQPCAALPDLSAFLALLEEKLGDLAGMLGRDAQPWYARSRARIARMIAAFWNGKRFVGYAADGAVIDTESLLFYRPLILGDRLPPEIVAAMAEDLSEGNGYLTPAGFLSQRFTSPEYDPLRPGAGRIVAAENLLVTLGLLRAGESAAAKEAARRWCGALLQGVSPVWPAERGFPNAVTAAAFHLLSTLPDN